MQAPPLQALPTQTLPAQALPTQTGTGDPEVTLANRYAPVVRLVDRAGRCGGDEAFEPTNVNAVLGSPEVALRGPWNSTNLVMVAPTAQDLLGRPAGVQPRLPRKPAVTRLHVRRVGGEDCADLQPGRVRARRHRGGLSRPALAAVLVLLHLQRLEQQARGRLGDGAAELQGRERRAGIDGVAVRGGLQPARELGTRAVGAPKLQLVDGTHPVVYPSLGSQANYYDSNLYLGRSAAEGVGCDDTARAVPHHPAARGRDPAVPGRLPPPVPVARVRRPVGPAAALVLQRTHRGGRRRRAGPRHSPVRRPTGGTTATRYPPATG